jgi:chromosome partitioning protein
VLLIDLDPQGNATMGSGIDKRDLKSSVYHLLVGLVDLAGPACARPPAATTCCRPTATWPAPRSSWSTSTSARSACATRSPPSPRRLRLHPHRLPALAVDAHPQRPVLRPGVIIPMQCEYYALEGLSDLVNTIKKVHANLNRDLKIIGLLRVMFDPRVTLQQQVSAQLEAPLRRQGVQAPSCRATCAWPRRPATACPAWCSTSSAKGAQAYMAFATR